MGLLLYPYFLLAFWYRGFLLGSFKLSKQVIVYCIDLLSVPLLIKTFFKPLKNEYRDGLVIFSVFIGILVKSLILLASLLILSIFLLLVVSINVVIFLLPVLIIILSFYDK